jgi:predicted enzyme related to lactoylglutathione lyase
MKRMHIHISVADLSHSISFYSALFAAKPSIVKPDYAKWMLEDPRVNFAISTRGRQPGLDHLGIQVENTAELHGVYDRLRQAGGEVIEQGQTACCYAKSEKSWIDDPAGIAWRPSTRPARALTMVTARGKIAPGSRRRSRTPAVPLKQRRSLRPPAAEAAPPLTRPPPPSCWRHRVGAPRDPCAGNSG